MRLGFAFLLHFSLVRLLVRMLVEGSSLPFQHSYSHLWFGSVILETKFREENDLTGQ